MTDYKTAIKHLELMMEKHQDVLLHLKENKLKYYDNPQKFFKKPIDKQ